jgi:hypothetical protein
MTTYIIGLAVIGFLAIVVWWFQRHGSSNGGFSLGKELNLDLWQPRTIRPLTKLELRLLSDIQGVAPGCLVMPQVSLSRFLKVKSSLSYSQWFYRVGRRCVDFLVCSPHGDVLGVIELVHTKRSKKINEGTEAKERALAMAQIPVWAFNPDKDGALQQLRITIQLEQSHAEVNSQMHPEWQATELAPRKAGIEALEMDENRWNQPWPNEDNRPSAFLDNI